MQSALAIKLIMTIYCSLCHTAEDKDLVKIPLKKCIMLKAASYGLLNKMHKKVSTKHKKQSFGPWGFLNEGNF